MTKYLLNYLILIALAGTQIASANPDSWRHEKRVSEDGVSLHLDYQVSKHVPPSDCDRCPTLVRISQAWLNVTAPALRDGDRVRIVFINYARSVGSSQENRDQQVVDLRYAEDGRFSGELGGFPISFESADAIFVYRQEIAVVVNGKWLKDPESRSSNFSLVLQ